MAKMHRRPPLPNLTSIRFFAALAVFLFHATRDQSIFRAGHLGVNLFFVLSGFILAYNHPVLGDRKRFFVARFARVYPLYLFAFLFSLPFISVVKPAQRSPQAFACFLTITQGWWIPLRTVFVPPAWTLSHEVFFYLVFPLVLPWLARNLRSWIWISLACWAFMVGSSTFVHFLWVPHHPAHEYFLRDLLNTPIFGVGQFLIGIVFGLHFEAHRPVMRTRHVLAALALCLPFLYLAEIIPRAHMEVATNGLIAVPFAVLIYTLASWESPVLGHPLLQLGGEISFGIYLLQMAVDRYLLKLLRPYFGKFSQIWLFPAVVIFCYFTYIFIEKPARNYLLRMFGYRSTHPKPIETTVALP